MRFSDSLLLSSIFLGAAFASPLLAVTTPGIASVSMQCAPALPQPQTIVSVRFDTPTSGLVFDFRNLSTGQTTTFAAYPQNATGNFQLLPGTYDLTVRRSGDLHSRSQWIDLVVPASVSTNGRGTGCRLLGPGATPNSGPLPSRR